ncbi:MAG: hypothetical protein KAR35_10455 [Candidatus Heimdallarchaeota archaeon]|nr:hypothetical protein [Candidatus Heimdallarchaeota archaeon]MCK5049778.1 hypothetical protein [Candidatus Heimdallarchaeota archaeon]
MVDRVLKQDRVDPDVRKDKSLESESTFLKDDLKTCHSSYDSIVTDLAALVKGNLSAIIKKINSDNIHQNQELQNEVNNGFELIDTKVLELEEIQRELGNIVSYISGLDNSIKTPTSFFKILDEESKLCSRFISGIVLIENRYADFLEEKNDDALTKINERYQDLLDDFSLFQGTIQEAIPLLDQLFEDLEGEVLRGQRINKGTTKI